MRNEVAVFERAELLFAKLAVLAFNPPLVELVVPAFSPPFCVFAFFVVVFLGSGFFAFDFVESSFLSF